MPLDLAQAGGRRLNVDLAGHERLHEVVHGDEAGVVVARLAHDAQQGVRPAGRARGLHEERLERDVDLDEVDGPPTPDA